MRTARQRRWDRILPSLAGFLVTVFILIAGLNLLWAVYGPSVPVTVQSVTVASPEQAGAAFTYTVEACKHTTLPSTLDRQLIGVGTTDYSYIFAEAHGVAPPGCHTTHVVQSLPSSVPAGRYFLRTAVTYQVNPLRRVTVTTDSNVFTVTASTNEANR